jgi:hypothetical protein
MQSFKWAATLIAVLTVLGTAVANGTIPLPDSNLTTVIVAACSLGAAIVGLIWQRQPPAPPAG